MFIKTLLFLGKDQEAWILCNLQQWSLLWSVACHFEDVSSAYVCNAHKHQQSLMFRQCRHIPNQQILDMFCHLVLSVSLNFTTRLVIYAIYSVQSLNCESVVVLRKVPLKQTQVADPLLYFRLYWMQTLQTRCRRAK